MLNKEIEAFFERNPPTVMTSYVRYLMFKKRTWRRICQTQLKHSHTVLAIIGVISTGKEKLRTIIYFPHVFRLSLMSLKILALTKPFKNNSRFGACS